MKKNSKLDNLKYFIRGVIFSAIIFLIALVLSWGYMEDKYEKQFKDSYGAIDACYKNNKKLYQEKRRLKRIIGNQSASLPERIKYQYKRQVVAASAYSPRVQETDSTPFVPACGGFVSDFQIAVSRDLKDAGWVCGTIVYIEEFDQWYVVSDVMNKRYEKTIDFFFKDTKTAKEFGRRQVNAYPVI